MRERVCCIYSSDEAFAVKLTDYINSRHLLPVQMIVYTQKEAVLKVNDKYDVELLIIDDENGGSWGKELSETVVYLTNGYEDTGNLIARYQPADKLVKKVIAQMKGFENRITGKKKTEVSCIYSPATKCFKTSLTLSLGLWSAKNGKSLFINLEQFAGLNNILSDTGGGLSQALYYFRAAKMAALGKIISCTDKLMGMDYFYPVTCGEDIAELESREFIDFLNMLIESEQYDFIWIDVGNTYGRPWRLMEICDRVIVPNPLDHIGKRKVSQMENYLMASGSGELLSRFVKFQIPYDEALAGGDIDCEKLLKPEWGVMVNEILGR